MDENTEKKIIISGIKSKYQVNNLNKKNNDVKKRVITEKWTFTKEQLNCENQFKLILDISSNNYNFTNDISKIVMQEINKKISGYKQQDKIKKKFNEEKFVTFSNVINKMIDCQLKCRYCLNEMYVLYDISREIRQWSVDRIDNDLGHNNDNYHLACLDCNLKRRRRTDEKFLFTKQLNIIKQEN